MKNIFYKITNTFVCLVMILSVFLCNITYIKAESTTSPNTDLTIMQKGSNIIATNNLSEKIIEPEISTETKEVDSFDELKAAAKDGGIIYITKNIVITEELKVEKSAKLTSKNGNYSLIRSNEYKDYLINVNNNNSLVLENITIDGAYSNGVKANKSLILVSSGELFIKEGTVIKNNCRETVAGNDGGGIYAIKSSKIFITGGIISDNIANRGAGIYSGKDVELTISGGEFINNKAPRGAGIYSYYSKQVDIFDVEMKNNSAKLGGAIYNYESLFTIYNGYFHNNEAKYTINDNENKKLNPCGGAIINVEGNMSIFGGKISNNIASGVELGVRNYDNSGIGGGIASNGGTLTIRNTEISNNKSTPGLTGSPSTYSFGGGIALYNGAVATLESGKISNNEADYGGGVYVTGSSVFNMNNGTIEKNLAHHQGGGMYVWQKGIINILAGYITYNECDATPSLDHSNFGAGGIMVEEEGHLYLGKTIITENTSIDTGEEPLKKPAIDKNGAAIAGCPTSDIKINSNNFAIYNNANTKNVEVSVATKDGADLIVSNSMLGGGDFNWEGTAPQNVFIQNSEKPSTINNVEIEESKNSYLTSNPTKKAIEKAKNTAEIYIMYNKTSAAGGGAAIGTNGYLGSYSHVIIAKEVIEEADANPNDLYDFNIYFWQPDYEENSYAISKANYILTPRKDASEVEGSVNGKKYSTGTINLEKTTLTLEDDTTINVGKASFKLADGEQIEFFGTNLNNNQDDEDIEYYWDNYDKVDFYVEEILPNGWTVDWKKELLAISKENELALRRVDLKFTAVNKPIGNLSIEKRIIDGIKIDDKEVFDFTATLKNEDGDAYIKPISYTITNGNGKIQAGVSQEGKNVYSNILFETEENVAYPNENGEIKFSLSKDQKVTFKNLPINTYYQLYEEPKKENDWLDAVWTTAGDIYKINSEENSGFIANRPNSLVEWISTSCKGGALVVTSWIDDINYDKNVTFIYDIELNDKSINGTYGEMQFTNGKAHFQLKSNQSIITTGLPDGVEYSIIELEKNGYESTSNGIKGTISVNDVSRAEFIYRKKILNNDNTTSPNTIDTIYIYITIMILSVIAILFIKRFHYYRFFKKNK